MRLLALAAIAFACTRPPDPSEGLPLPSVISVARAAAAAAAPAAAPVLMSTPPPAIAPAPAPAWISATTMNAPPVVHPEGVADVVAHVPSGYDVHAPINLVIFFHGSDQCIAQLALGGDVVCRPGTKADVGAGLAWRHDDAGTMSLFAAPQMLLWGSGSPGRFSEPGYFRAFVAELLHSTFAPGLGGPKSLDDVASITLVAHSAGYLPLLEILGRADLDEKVQNVILLDALFGGGVDTLSGWVERGLARGQPRKLVAVYGAWGSNAAHGHAIATRIERRAKGSTAVDPPGALSDAARAHVVTVKLWPHVEHAWMLLLTMSKAIAGLGLPPRPVSPPADPAFPAPPPGESVALGDTRTGSLDTGAPRLQSGALFDEFALDLQGGQRVAIEAHGGPSFTEPCCSLDVVLRVLRDGRSVAADDDSAGGFDARAEVTAPSPGRYVVRVSTYGAGERRGPYSLRVF
jgi:hypothetical protein